MLTESTRFHIAAALLAWLCLAFPVAAGPVDAAQQHGPLHVASPDWRDQVIYFLMIDRFDDGDPGNNDQGAGEFDPSDGRRYSGGDLRGVTRRIDYIRGLGATAVWITPPVANQWWDGDLGYGGYHGYWAENFMAVDAHYGSLDDYRDLSRAVHGAGMYLVQDVVVNHTGNFFGYRDGWDPADPTVGYRPNPASVPVSAPSQWPFSLNDPRIAEHREAAVYHYTPVIDDFTERRQELDFQLADLDDLNTETPLVRSALRESFGYWIREVGVDAFRIDTAFHVPPDFFADFMHARGEAHPGMHAVAAATGRNDFLAFGEGFGIDRAYAETAAAKLENYVRAADGAPLLGSMINFPLYGSLGDVFARGRPSAELGHRIRSMMRVHAQPHLMPSFVDNHDVERFLAGGSEAALRQALLAIMTLPGIPTLYYGTEQGFRMPRRSMFAGGHGADGRDHFDTGAPLYRYIAELTALRRAHRVLSRGVPSVLHENAAAPGALAYRMQEGTNALLVVFNTADRETLLDNLDTGMAPGSRLRLQFASDEAADVDGIVVGAQGRLTLRLPPRAGRVWSAEASSTEEPLDAGDSPLLTIDPLDQHTPVAGDLRLSGSAPPHASLRIVVDGDLAAGATTIADAEGRWTATVATDSMIDATVLHGVVAWADTLQAVSDTQRFRVRREWTPLVDVSDPSGDDHGPDGRYSYPDDPLWRAARPLDIHAVQVSGSGAALQVEVRMRQVVATWNPPNGFDHVAVTLFVELPGRDGGARVMPLQNAELPGDMRWHYRLRAGGWSNALFSADGAGAQQEGTPVSPGAAIDVDHERHLLRFTLPAAALGNPPSLSGARVYVTTWDYDGGYRRLGAEAGGHAFGGGDGSRDPLVMDDTEVIVLP
jgi:glycosidase